jgi:hypothetical protein
VPVARRGYAAGAADSGDSLASAKPQRVSARTDLRVVSWHMHWPGVYVDSRDFLHRTELHFESNWHL